MMNKIKAVTLLTSVSILLSGCATIVGKSEDTIPLASTPSGAQVSITDDTGKVVFAGTTPTMATLKKSNGSYWGKKSYIISTRLDGYEPQTTSLTESANGWYMAGNIMFGGLVGWFLVDPWNGGMYSFDMNSINSSLHKNSEASPSPYPITSTTHKAGS
jgi:uncharacterized protein YceK